MRIRADIQSDSSAPAGHAGGTTGAAPAAAPASWAPAAARPSPMLDPVVEIRSACRLPHSATHALGRAKNLSKAGASLPVQVQVQVLLLHTRPVASSKGSQASAEWVAVGHARIWYANGRHVEGLGIGASSDTTSARSME